MNVLDDRVVIVTGGARGIGAAFCAALAAAGARVAVADVLDGSRTVAAIAAAGGTAIGVRADVTDEASVAAMTETVRSRLGPVDALVNNAALFASLDRKPFLELTGAEWDAVMAVNVRGSFLCAKAVAPAMMERRAGRIVNIASGTVFKGVSGLMHYVASKGAVVAMTRCLARELGPYEICVNAIAPGLTMSEGVLANPGYQGQGSQATVATRALKRDQHPADLVGALVFLCSGASNFVTGQTLVVDGGAVMN